MKLTRPTLLVALLLVVQLVHAQSYSTIVQDVGFVHDENEVTGNPIVVLDEHHNSVVLQIEQAVMLVRLRRYQQLKDIALEGHLFSDPLLDGDWFRRSSSGQNQHALNVAVQLLSEGEISAAEFMLLAFSDTNVTPTERVDEYQVDLPPNVVTIPQVYLMHIAGKSGVHLTQADQLAFTKVRDELDTLTANDAPIEQIRDAYERLRIIRLKILRQLYVDDPWSLKHFDFYNERISSLYEWSNRAKEIRARAEREGVPLTADQHKFMQTFIDFYEGRARASDTMADAAIRLAKKVRTSPVALIIGAGHTIDVQDAFRKVSQPHVVLRTNSYRDPQHPVVDIDSALWQRRAKGDSLYSEGLMKAIQESVPDGSKKNPPTISAPWLQAKAELYLIADQLQTAVLGGGGNGGGLPPFNLDHASWPPEDNARRWVGLDDSRIQIVPEQASNRTYYHLDSPALERLEANGLTRQAIEELTNRLGAVTTNKNVAATWVTESQFKSRVVQETEVEGLPTVLFPVQLNYQDTAAVQEVWIKAGEFQGGRNPTEEREDAERLLMAALNRTRASGVKSETSAEDDQGRVQISVDTVIAIGSTPEIVQTTSLYGI